MGEHLMERVYYNPANVGSFGGVDRLQKKVKKGNVRKWLSYQNAYTLHKKNTKKFPRRKTLVGGIDNQWESYLMVISSISKANLGYNYILLCIDVLSKFGWAVAIRDKSGKCVAAALKHIIDSSGRKCLSLQTDKGKEYYNYSVQSYLKKMQIHHFSTENDDIKASIAERFVRTVKDRIWRYFTYKRSKTFVHDLQNIIDSYNNTVHTTTNMAPASVTKNDEFRLLDQMYNIPVSANRAKFAIGDTVRISMTKKSFRKGYDAKWTEEIFKISSIEKTTPITYRLSDLQGDFIKGTFYTQELQRVRIKADTVYRIEEIIKTRKKGKTIEYYVKWFGFPEKFNSWVQKKDIHV